MLLFLSLKSFFVKSRLLSGAFSLLLAACLCGGIFGLNYAFCSAEYYNRYLSDMLLYEVCAPTKDIKSSARAFIDEYSQDICFAEAEYLADTDGVELAFSAVIYSDGDFIENLSAVYGSALAVGDIASGARKVMLPHGEFSPDIIGDSVTIAGVEYEVTGLSLDGYIPLFALEDGQSVEKVNILLNDPIKGAEAEAAFCAELSDIFGAYEVSSPDSENFQSVFDYIPTLLPTLFLVLLGFVNLGFLYIYFVKLRARQYSVYRICGAGVREIFGLFSKEILTLYTAAFAVAACVYKLTAAAAFAPDMSFGESVGEGVIIIDCMSPIRYLAVYAFLAALLLLSFAPFLFRAVRKDIHA